MSAATPSGPAPAPRGAAVPATPAAPLLPDTDLTLPDGAEAEVVTDDGARLATTILDGATSPGEAPSGQATVVMPHCWTGSRSIGVPVARRLVAAGHRVVLYDQRGHGASSTGDDALTIDRLGSDLAAVVTQLDLRDVVLAGHSMGGMTAMAFACRHADLARDRVRALVLVATAAHGLATPGRTRFWRAALAGDLANRALARPWLGYRLVRPTFGADPVPEHVEATRALFAATRPDVRLACVEAMGAMDLRTALAALDVPAVVLLGGRDKLIVNALTRAVADHLPGADLVELAGAGHMLPLERPDEVAAAIRRLAR